MVDQRKRDSRDPLCCGVSAPEPATPLGSCGSKVFESGFLQNFQIGRVIKEADDPLPVLVGEEIGAGGILLNPPEVTIVKADERAADDLVGHPVSHKDDGLVLVFDHEAAHRGHGPSPYLIQALTPREADLVRLLVPEFVELRVTLSDPLVAQPFPIAVADVDDGLEGLDRQVVELGDKLRSLERSAEGAAVYGVDGCLPKGLPG